MNIFNRIKKDHDEARSIMDEILNTPEASKRTQLFTELKIAILAHAEAEEKTFYEDIKKRGNKDLKDEVPHFEEEHDEAEKLFKEIEKQDADSYLWWEKFGELRKALTHHMKEEEDEVFKEMKKKLSPTISKESGEEMEELEMRKKDKLEVQEGKAA